MSVNTNNAVEYPRYSWQRLLRLMLLGALLAVSMRLRVPEVIVVAD